MKSKIFLSLILFLNLSLAVAQQKRNKTPKVVYRDNRKAPVDCEVIKTNSRDGKEISLGNVDPSFIMEKNCNQGDIYRFHPKSSNYRDVIKECNIKDDTIFLIPQQNWAILWGNSYFIPKVDKTSKKNYGISAIASQFLLSYSDENKDSLIASRERALELYFNGDFPKSSNRVELVNSLNRNLEVKPDLLLKRNYAEEIIKTSNGKKIADAFSLSKYYFESNGDLKEALRWAQIATDDNPSAYWAEFQKAKIIGGKGDKKGALESSYLSLATARNANDTVYIDLIEKFIKRLK